MNSLWNRPKQWLQKQKQDRAVAGLEIFLSVIIMIFIVGIIVMSFQLAKAEMIDATDDTAAIAVINDTGEAIKSAVDWFALFIVMAAIVVLILFVVLIVRAVRGGGLISA